MLYGLCSCLQIWGTCYHKLPKLLRMNVAKLCFLTKYGFRYFYSFDRKKDMVVWTFNIVNQAHSGLMF